MTIKNLINEYYTLDDEGKIKVKHKDDSDIVKVVEDEEIKVDETVTLYYDFIERMDERYKKIDSLDITLVDYTKEYRQKEAEKIYSEMDDDRINTGNKILSIIDKRINTAKKEHELKVQGVDNQLLISNAFEMLKILGENATAYQVNNIIAPFIKNKDYQTLSIIRTYVDNTLTHRVIEDINFPMIVSDEFRHTTMKEMFKDILFSNTAKFMRLQGGLRHEIMIRTTGQECGYYNFKDDEENVL